MSFTLSRAAAFAALIAPATAQAPPFQTPGMPSVTPPPPAEDTGQTSRFASVFNPAFAFIVDTSADYVDFHGSSADDGVDLELRVLEFVAQANVDPDAWAYFVAATDAEELAIEEAAIHYTGLGGNSTLRAGRFFVDFGKQMQVHVHELRTLERPLVLRAYLGDEVAGDGVQYDAWTTVGEETLVRWSLGAFGSLVAEESEDDDPATVVAERKDVDELNFTARVTGFRDVGAHGVLQLGASARWIPEYAFESEEAGSVEDLSNAVYGFDATYGWTSETGLERWTLGLEYLLDTGDVGAALADDDTLEVFDATVGGAYGFVDYAWNPHNSAGVQYSALELPDAQESDASELELYYTRLFSEFHRLRFVASAFDSDADDDALRFAIQYTAFVGAHSHGVNW